MYLSAWRRQQPEIRKSSRVPALSPGGGQNERLCFLYTRIHGMKEEILKKIS